jgi:hypothetical protein
VISRATAKFWCCYKELPDEIRILARQVYGVFKNDPWYPALHFKRVHSSQPIYSVRVSRDYRALGVLSGDRIVWFWVGSHSDYDKLLNQL